MDKIYSHTSSIFTEMKPSQEPGPVHEDKEEKQNYKLKQTMKIVLHIYALLKQVRIHNYGTARLDPQLKVG